MPKISVYLPDELHRQAREHDLPVSALTQAAIRAALDRSGNAEWARRVRARPTRMTEDVDTSALLAEVRDEFGA